MPGSKWNGPNGLVSSPDGRWFYIGGWGSLSLVRLSRGQTPVQLDSVDVGFHIDNVRWAPDGSLLAAGHLWDNAAALGQCLGRQLYRHRPAGHSSGDFCGKIGRRRIGIRACKGDPHD